MIQTVVFSMQNRKQEISIIRLNKALANVLPEVQYSILILIEIVGSIA